MSQRRRHHLGSRQPRPIQPLPIEAVWVEGPRTEAWNELWRRLLAVVLAGCDCDDRDASADSPDCSTDDQSPAIDQIPGEVQQ